jgi:hypothetical protein
MIRSIVEMARLTDPRAAAYLADVIIRRRDKTVAYGITGTNPLDRFAMTREAGIDYLTFDHAAVRLGLAAETASYRVDVAALDNSSGTRLAANRGETITGKRIAIPAAAFGPADTSGDRYASVSIRTLQDGAPGWAHPIHVTVRNRHGELSVVGIDRPARS